MKITGLAVSNGIVMNNVYRLEEHKIEINNDLISNVELEIINFHNALKISTIELDHLKEKASKRLELAELEVFSSHQLIVNDPLIINGVVELISKTNLNSASAYKNVIDKFISKFNSLDNEYISERSIDIKDVYQRVVGKLINKNLNKDLIMSEEVILLAKDITPSLVLSLNQKLIKGIILKDGGKTSHSSLMIKNLEIPLIIGVGNKLDKLINGDFLIMDGEIGNIISSPSSDEIYEYIKLQNERRKEHEMLLKYVNEETITNDGFRVKILANINSDIEVESALRNGAEGIGLFRTEFMYLDSKKFPTEDELFEAYKRVLDAFSSKNVIIRTLDIGGDKIPKYLSFKNQSDLRGLPLALSNDSVLSTQIKALLRANTHNNLYIMFPMVGSIGKLAEAVNLVDKCKLDLLTNGIVVSKNYRLGIMVEEIDVVNDIKSYASKVDFFSIGTNDLLQSMYGTDRMSINNSISTKHLEPEFLKVIKSIIDASHAAGITTSICGEMASDIDSISSLIKLGINSLSMSPNKILKTRYIISGLFIRKLCL